MNEADRHATSAYVVRIKNVTPQQLVVGHMTAAVSDWGLALAHLLENVWKFLNTFEDITVGPAMARLLPAEAGRVLVEAGFPVAQEIDDAQPFSIAELPECEAATLLLQGPYERLPEATAALDGWMKSNDRCADPDCHAPWLIFWATPDDVNLPSELRTELVWPLKFDRP